MASPPYLTGIEEICSFVPGKKMGVNLKMHNSHGRIPGESRGVIRKKEAGFSGGVV
jgi:hypothetical protein